MQEPARAKSGGQMEPSMGVGTKDVGGIEAGGQCC